MTRLVHVVLAIALSWNCLSAQSPRSTAGTVRGVVFALDASAARAVVPAARLSLDGPMHADAESDSEGKFEFKDVPPGSYTITAQAPGMTSQ